METKFVNFLLKTLISVHFITTLNNDIFTLQKNFYKNNRQINLLDILFIYKNLLMEDTTENTLIKVVFSN